MVLLHWSMTVLVLHSHESSYMYPSKCFSHLQALTSAPHMYNIAHTTQSTCHSSRRVAPSSRLMSGIPLVSKALTLQSTMIHCSCSQTHPSCPACLSPECLAFSCLGSAVSLPDVYTHPSFSPLLSHLFLWFPNCDPPLFLSSLFKFL